MNIDTLLAAARFLDWQEQQSRPDIKFEKAGKLALGKDVDARTVAGFGDERLPQVYTVVLPPLVCSTPAALPGAALTLPTKPPERLEAELEAAAQAMPLAPSRDHHGDRSPAGITRAGADSENIDPRSRNLSPSRAPDPSLAIPAQELRTTSVPALLRPRSPPTSDAFPGLVENRADEPSSTDQRRRPGGAGTREVHNKLEKTRRTPDPLALALASRRRAYLKECFEALKKSIPNIEEKKTSNLTILRGALRYVQVLKRKEREFEHELDRLARHKIALQRHLLELCTGLPSQMDAQRLEKLLHQPTSPNDHDDATSTASEGEDNIDEELENSSFTMPHPSSHQWVQNTSDATKHGTQQLLTPDASGQTMNNFATVAAPSQNYPGPIQHTSFLSMSQTSAGHGVSQNALLEQTNMALHRELTPNSSTPSVMNKSAAELSVREARLSPSQITTPQVHKPVLPHPPSHIPPGMTRVIAAAMPCLVVQDSSQNVSIQSLGNSIVAKPPTHNATMQAASQPSPMQRLIAAAPCLVVQDQPNATGSPQNSSGHEIVAAVAPVSRKQPAGQTSVIQSAMGYVGRTLTNPSPCCLPAAIPHIGAPPISTTALPRPFPSCRMSVAPVIISRSASATAPPPGTQISVGKPVALGSVIPTPILIQVTKAAPVIGTPLAIGQATAAPSVLGPSPVLIGCSPSLGTAPSTKNTISVLSTPSVTAPGRAAVLIGQQPRYLEPQTASGLAIPGGGATFVLPGHLSEELPPVATPSAL